MIKGLYICASLTVVLLGCHTSTGPEIPKPGKRDYTWTIETISYPGSTQTDLTTLWASCPRDVYVGGHNEAGWGWLYHFGGYQWSRIDQSFPRKMDVGQIYGFGPNDIWIAGMYAYRNPAPPPNYLDSSVIFHYDGSAWMEATIDRGRGLWSIWGPGSQNLFASGSYGTLYRYDGAKWNRLQADSRIWFGPIGGRSNQIYMLGYVPNSLSPDHITHEYLMNWDNNNFTVVDSILLVPGYKPTFGDNSIGGVDTNIYTVGDGVFRKSELGWSQILSTGQSFGGLYGTRREHIFACGSNKTLYHFNGRDWKQLEVPGDPALPLIGVWCTEEEVFVLGTDGSKSYVIHGY